jgi:hypothetical protein
VTLRQASEESLRFEGREKAETRQRRALEEFEEMKMKKRRCPACGQMKPMRRGKSKTLVPASLMAFWEFKDKPWSKQEIAAHLDSMKPAKDGGA